MATWELVFVGLLLPLYSRIAKPADALRCETRMRIVERLRLHGPRHLRALARDLGIDPSTLREHLRVLRRTSHVRIARAGSCAVITVPGQDPATARVTSAARAQDAVMRVVMDHRGEIERTALEASLPELPARLRSRAISDLAREGALRRDLVGIVETVRLRSIPPPSVCVRGADA